MTLSHYRSVPRFAKLHGAGNAAGDPRPLQLVLGREGVTLEHRRDIVYYETLLEEREVREEKLRENLARYRAPLRPSERPREGEFWASLR